MPVMRATSIINGWSGQTCLIEGKGCPQRDHFPTALLPRVLFMDLTWCRWAGGAGKPDRRSALHHQQPPKMQSNDLREHDKPSHYNMQTAQIRSAISKTVLFCSQCQRSQYEQILPKPTFSTIHSIIKWLFFS